jgi:DNA-directed RNA polymerase specialized sigma24 family protein
MNDQLTNNDLVRRAIAGDIAAFGSLYDRTVRLVRAVAADAGRDAADDVTHDTFLRVVARLPEEERLAVRFFFLNERSIEETASLLNRSRSGTYAVLHRAKVRLARWLEECGVSR